MSAQTAKRDSSGAIIPSSFTVQAFQQSGAATTAYAGRFKVEETEDGTVWNTVYSSANDESEIECELNNVIVDEHGNYIVTDNAEKLFRKLKKKGFDAIVKKQNGQWIVQCGVFSVRKNAEALAKQLKKAGFSAIIK